MRQYRRDRPGRRRGRGTGGRKPHSSPGQAWQEAFFSGRFRRDNLDSFTSYLDQLCVSSYCYEANFERLDWAEQLAADKGVSLPQLALAYVTSQPLDIYDIGCNSGAEFGRLLIVQRRRWLESGGWFQESLPAGRLSDRSTSQLLKA